MSFQQTQNLPNYVVRDPIARLLKDDAIFKQEIIDLKAAVTGASVKCGYQPTVFNENAADNVAAYIQGIRATVIPAYPGEAAYVSNATTGEITQYFDGVRNPAGDPVDENTHFTWFSASKPTLAALVIAKTLEERWWAPGDAVSTYVPEWTAAGFGATGCFITNVTALDIPTYPWPTLQSAGGWTGTYTLTDFALSDIKMSHLMSMSVGIAYDFEFAGGFLPALTLTGPFVAPIGAPNYLTGASKPNIAVHYLYQNDLGLSGELPGIFVNTYKTIRTYGGDSTQFKAVNDSAVYNYDYFRVVAQKKLPLAFRPGTAFVYGPCLELLGGVLNKIAQSKGYTCLGDYIYKKIFTPMGIDTNKLFYLPNFEKPQSWYDNHFVATFNRAFNPAYSFAGFNLGVSATDPNRDPAYPMVQGTNVPTNQGPLVWATDYKYDNLGIGYWITANCTVRNGDYSNVGRYGATLGAGLVGTFSEFAKLAECLANRGIYNNKKIVSESALKFLEMNAQPFITDPGVTGQQITVVNGSLYGLLAGMDADNTTWKACQGISWSKELFSIIAAPTSNPNPTNTPNSIYPSISIQFPFCDTSFGWAGANRTRLVYDNQTKMVSIIGSQCWTVSTYALTNAADGINYVANILLEATKVQN